MKLVVEQIDKTEVYHDFARVPEQFRKDRDGKAIPEGAICRVRVGGRGILAVARGSDSTGPSIRMDDRTRTKLSVTVGQEYDFVLARVRVFGSLRWSWVATDPAYRASARTAVISLVLGLIGLALGIISIVRK